MVFIILLDEIFTYDTYMSDHTYWHTHKHYHTIAHNIINNESKSKEHIIKSNQIKLNQIKYNDDNDDDKHYHIKSITLMKYHTERYSREI